MGYVALKHALSAAALAAVDDPGRAPVVAALAACASSGPLVGDDLSRLTGRPPEAIRDELLATGVCVETGDGGVGFAPAFAPYAAYAARQTARAAEMTRALSAPPPAGVLPAVWRAAVLFNVGLFFECHEYLEGPWRAARADRALYHGLIQAAAGCYHCERGNVHGTAVLLGKAVAKLRAYAPAALGIDVAGLVDELAAVRAAALAVPPHLPRGREHLPVIRLAADPDAPAAAAAG